MGREIKRVALDFKWVHGKVWAGYINPYWVDCPFCNGKGCEQCEDEGQSPYFKEAYEAWQPIEPPSGEGWQVWENVSEGSPVSPVFATSEDLVQWLIKQGHSEQNARVFVEKGYVFSAVFTSKGYEMDIDGAATTWGSDDK